MSLVKAIIINLDSDLKIPIPVMFNPPDYQLQKTNNFAEIKVPGRNSTQHQFLQGQAQTLTVEMFFDTTNLGVDVRLYTNLIVSLTELTPKTHEPSKLLFLWGTLAFQCRMTAVTQKYEYFDALGQALRAKLTVTLVGYDTLEESLSKIKLESSDKTKGWIFKTSDTLQGIAAKEYDDSRKWRVIAEANNIDNPLTIQVGRRLKLPTY